MTESAQIQLKKMFDASALCKLYLFLKTPQAKEIVTFEPPENPNKFTFYLQKLYSGMNPEFENHGSNLRRELRRCGLKAVFGLQGQHVISHPTLSLKSNLVQIMAVWFDAKYKQFVASTSIVTLLFTLLVLNPKPEVVRWSTNGQMIQIVDLQAVRKIWGHNGVNNANQWGFYKNMSSTNYMSLSHPILHKNCSKANWLYVYLKKNQKYTKYYHIAKNHVQRDVLFQPGNLVAKPYKGLQVVHNQKVNEPSSIRKFMNPQNYKQQIVKQMQFLKETIKQIQNKCPELYEDLLFVLLLSNQFFMWDKKQMTQKRINSSNQKISFKK